MERFLPSRLCPNEPFRVNCLQNYVSVYELGFSGEVHIPFGLGLATEACFCDFHNTKYPNL